MHADSIGIEEPESRAFQTGLVIPVPDLAANHSRLLVIGRRKDASAVGEVVSLVASSASSACVVSSAVSVHSDTDPVVVEDPVLRAFSAASIDPGFAASIRRSSII